MPDIADELIDYLSDMGLYDGKLDLTIRAFFVDRHLTQPKKDPNVIGFGKYKGKRVDDVFKSDPGYIKWLDKSEYISKDQHEIIRKLLA